MSDENTNPEGEVSSEATDLDRMAALLAGSDEPEPEHEPEGEEPEQEAEPEEPRVRRLKVKIDGQETELPEDEVAAGYQRQQDYTKKTQEVAEQRKAVEAERLRVPQERAYYAQQLQQMQQQLQPPEIDWEALKDDPFAFNAALTKEMDRQKKAAQIQAEQQRIWQQQQYEEHQHRAKTIAEGAARLAELIPEYADDAKRPAVQAAIRTYAQSVGFSAEELAEASDPRAVVVLNKARLYDELLARAQKVKPTVVQTAKPGVARAQVPQAKKALERLKQTGSDADALAVFANFVTR
jgi:hypothetical protein